jgi:hypothetical protein
MSPVYLDKLTRRNNVWGIVVPVLRDANGTAMPLVWVQERYPNGVPSPNFIWNGNTGLWWTTYMGLPKSIPGYQSSPQLTNGSFVDFLRWDFTQFPTSPSSFVHEYYAATKSYTNGAWGISLGSFTATFTLGPPASITHQ